MGKYFDDIHAGWQSQLAGGPCEIGDTEEIKLLRNTASDYDGLMSLGDALSRQLRYREAAKAYNDALNLRPECLKARRLRAGRYLSTLQYTIARDDFLYCLTHTGSILAMPCIFGGME